METILQHESAHLYYTTNANWNSIKLEYWYNLVYSLIIAVKMSNLMEMLRKYRTLPFAIIKKLEEIEEEIHDERKKIGKKPTTKFFIVCTCITNNDTKITNKINLKKKHPEYGEHFGMNKTKIYDNCIV